MTYSADILTDIFEYSFVRHAHLHMPIISSAVNVYFHRSETSVPPQWSFVSTAVVRLYHRGGTVVPPQRTQGWYSSQAQKGNDIAVD